MASKETQTIDYSVLKNQDFKDERELRDYILQNKEYFCKEALGVEYKSHIVECALKPIPHLFDNTIIVDLIFIDTEDKAHFIELKNPRNKYGECLQGLGQCLAYYYAARVYRYDIADVYLVTTGHSNLIPAVIRDNNLKVKYIYFSKGVIAKPQL